MLINKVSEPNVTIPCLQASQIAHLIKNYTEELKNRSLIIPPEKMDASMIKKACRSSVFMDSYDEDLLSAMLNKA